MKIPARPLRILITNNTLDIRAGSELFVRDLAIGLMRRGHFPIAYSQKLGKVAEELHSATIPVVSDLNDLSVKPDIIHGQHHLETITAALYYPDVPIVYTCHGWLPWQEWPPVYPTVLKYVAVDKLCEERLLTTHGIARNKVKCLYNFVDTKRFNSIKTLPTSPTRALILSNYAERVPDAILSACKQIGIEKVDIAGAASGNKLDKPEEVFAQYDIVFAKARAALEAMASGCAVVVTDYSKMAGLVTSENLSYLREFNFGVRALQQLSLSHENVLAEIKQYNVEDAAKITTYIRENATLEQSIDKWLSTYFEVLDEWTIQQKLIADKNRFDAIKNYLHYLTPRIKSTEYHAHLKWQFEQQAKHLDDEINKLKKIRQLESAEQEKTMTLLAQKTNENSELESRLDVLLNKNKDANAALVEALNTIQKLKVDNAHHTTKLESLSSECESLEKYKKLTQVKLRAQEQQIAKLQSSNKSLFGKLKSYLLK